MQWTGILLLAAGSMAAVPSPSDRTGNWWIRFSAPLGELNGEASRSIEKVPPNLEAFPGSTLVICSTSSVAELGAARRATVSGRLVAAGVAQSHIRDSGECGPETNSGSFDHAESVLIIMQRVG